VWGHGFVSIDGEKLSKSLGNVIAPEDVTARFGVDGCRYLFLREVPFNRDGDFSWSGYTERFNADLANDLGNLLSRTLAMVQRYLNGEVPEWPAAGAAGSGDERDRQLLETLATAGRDYQAQIEEFAIHTALATTWTCIQNANRYIEENKPWALAKDPEQRARLRGVLRNLLEVLRQVSVMIYPAMPTKAVEMRRQLGLGADFGAIRYDSELTARDIPDWKSVAPGGVLFPRLEA
jgi:methionyl-tRNA synthetase